MNVPISHRAVWAGASGRLYEYYVKAITTKFVPGQWGNLIICQRMATHWQPLYIGQGDIGLMLAALLKQGCVIRKQASHIHERLNPDLLSRQHEAQDLLRHYPGAYTPGGCTPRRRAPQPPLPPA